MGDLFKVMLIKNKKNKFDLGFGNDWVKKIKKI
jgi:hypothetical protein